MYLLLRDLIEAEDPDGMDNLIHEKAREVREVELRMTSQLIDSFELAVDDLANGIVTTKVMYDDKASKFIVEKVNIFKKDELPKK